MPFSYPKTYVLNKNYVSDDWRMSHRTGPDGVTNPYYDRTIKDPNFVENHYLNQAKLIERRTRDMLLNYMIRGHRLDGEATTQADLHRGLETGYQIPSNEKVQHLEFRHKPSKFAHLYRKCH